MKNADLGGRRKVRSGRQTIFNSVAQPQPAARERMMMVVPMMSSRSVHGKYVKCGSLVRSSAGGLRLLADQRLIHQPAELSVSQIPRPALWRSP